MHKNNLKKSNRFAYPAGVQVRYAKALQALVWKMAAGVNHEVMHFFHAHGAKNQTMDAAPKALKSVMSSLTTTYTQLFSKHAWTLAQQAVDEMDEASDAAVRINAEALVNMVSITKSLSDIGLEKPLKEAVVANVDLIKSIPEKYLDQVKILVYEAFDKGRGLADIQAGLQEYGAQAARRAKFIAEDQTRKTYNHLNAKRVTKVGINNFEWLHSGGGQHPRPYHIDVLNGEIFSFDDPPIIDDETGETGLPGDLPNCGCTFAAVVPGADQEAQEDEANEES